MSITGCSRNKDSSVSCDGGDSGIRTGQVTTITLQPQQYGVSLSNGQIGSTGGVAAADCKGNTVTVAKYTYGSTNLNLVDVNPTTGSLCAGTWNRNSPGGVADFTNCTPNGGNDVAYITASGGGATSNPVAVYVHPLVANVTLSNTSQSDCVSQGRTIQLSATATDGSGNPIKNIGHLTFAPQTTSIVSIDQNGVATAQLPGSTIVNATVSSATSTAGVFSTCPPTSISLTVPNSSTSSASVSPNNTQPLTTTVLDKNNVTLTGLTLSFLSTTPTTIPVASTGAITPTFPGAAEISAFCMPPTCNPSPTNLVGLYGNGKPVSSNPIQITSPGTNSTFLYVASTQSQYVAQYDQSLNATGTALRLPYVPNSMQLSQDGSTLYFGSSTELMVVSTTNGALTREDTSVPGKVIAISPDNGTIVITDPLRKLVNLYNSTGVVSSSYGGVATNASWSLDSSTVYITTTDNNVLIYSTQTGWHSNPYSGSGGANDVVVAVPAVGAFVAGTGTTNAIGYCPVITTSTSSGGVPTLTSVTYYPPAGSFTSSNDRVTATNDGNHVLGANVVSGVPTLNDIKLTGGTPTGQCPPNGVQFSGTQIAVPLVGDSAAAITGVQAASDSSIAFVTYTDGTAASPKLPSYVPSTGAFSNVALTGSATAPVSGIFSTDNSTFFVGTSGDSLVHLVAKNSSGTYVDSSTIAPKLPVFNGTGFATADLLAQHVRSSK